MKFMVDEMLMRLGRWLRAAGYDTAIADNGMRDKDIMRRVIDEDRLLLTRDRKMMEFRHAQEHVVVLVGRDVHAWSREVTARLGIDWMHRPFSRCLACNAPLKQGDHTTLGRVPPHSRSRIDETCYCPGCGKTFWAGSHVERMKKKLMAWKKAHQA